MDKVRILDSRDISCSIYDDLIEVYDQKGSLVNDYRLNFKVPSHMSGEAAYGFVESQGVDVQKVCYDIINEAFFVNKDYDLLLEESAMTFFSPSANQFVEEPYQGVFSWLEKQLKDMDKEEEKEQEAIIIPTNETTYVEVDEKEQVIPVTLEQKPAVIQEPVQQQQEIHTPEPQPYVRANVQPSPPSQMQVGQPVQPAQPAYVAPVTNPVHNALPMANPHVAPEQSPDKLKVWMMACQQVLKGNDPTSQMLKQYALSYIQSQMVYKPLFDINEKDVVFYLIENFQVSSDALAITRAAFYEAYILNS